MSDISKRLSDLSPEKLELLRKKLKKEGKAVKKDVIVKRQNQAAYPMSAAQKRLWFLNQLDPDSAFYSIPSALRLKGSLNIPVLEKSINEIIKRHEVLRASFHIDDKGEAQQIIAGELIVPLNQIDISDIPANKIEAKVQQLLKDEAAAPFKIDAAPLMRVALIKLNSGEYVFIINMHHIIADGWSIGVFIQEVIMLYQAFAANLASPLKDLSLQFFDYAQWQEDRQNEEAINKQLSYWTEYLKGMPAQLELPVDHPRPSLASYKGRQHIFSVGKELTAKLRKLTKENNVSLYMTLMSAFQTFLYKFSNQDDFGVGAPIANRNRKEIEEIIGFFVNTIALRANFTKDISFLDLINRVRNDVLEAAANQDVPFEKIVETILPKRELSVSPLFQVMFDLQKAPLQSMKLKDLTLEIVDIEIEVAKFDLLFIMLEYEDDIKCTLEYNTDLFERASIERMSEYFLALLRQIVDNPKQKISLLSLISEAEKKKIVVDWNKTGTSYPDKVSVTQLFEKQVEKTPQNTAVIFEGQEILYCELNRRSNQLAHYLIKNGVKKDDMVGIFMERSIDMIIGMLGILKTGAVYVPIDTSYPKERIAFIMDDTKTPALLTQQSLAADLPESQSLILNMDTDRDKIDRESADNPPMLTNADDRAYVIYTSGSTGKPKGVVVPHRAINRLVLNTDYVQINEDDRIAQASNAAFDAATFEIWGALLNGAILAGITKDVMLSTQEFVDQLRSQKITTLFLTTALFNQLANEVPGAFRTLKNILFGGELVDPKSVRSVLLNDPPQRLLHVYGPTENTTFSTWHLVKDVAEDASTVPIGKTIANSTYYVVDKNFQPVPVGVPGELCLGGDGLSLGYYNRPQLTAEKFVINPFNDKEGTRLYRTGDLVRYLPGGDIEFLGRIDQQVKIRGFRIELGEIESLLKEYPQLKDAAVLAREDTPGDRRLVGYIVPNEETVPNNNELRNFLLEKLPDYMVPFIFIKMDALPINPNGKVDRKALPKPDQSRPDLEKAYVAPRTELEQFIVDIWKDILGIDKIGIYDNFFDLGGNSLKAAVFANRLQKELDEVVHVGVVFKAPLIAELAMYMAEYYPDLVEKKFGIKAEASHKYGVRIENAEDIEKIDDAKIDQFRGLITPLPTQTTSRAQKNPPAVFLLSPPRSGSTLLRIMMAGNPKLFSPPELDLLSFNTLQERKTAFSQDGLEIWLEATIRAIMEIKEYDAVEAKRIMAEYEQQNLTTNEFFGLMQEWIGGRYIVDKTPTYAFDPEILKRMETGFEDPLYIHLIRHPYAMIYSFIEAKLDKNFFRHSHSFSRHELAELIWIISNQNTINFLKNIPSQRQFRLKFESLLADPRHELENLCDFLNIEFAEEMLKPYQGKKMTDGVTSNSQMVGDFKFYLHKNINAGVAEKWKKFHSHDFLSDISWKLAEEFGYTVEKDLARKLTLEKHEALTKIMPAPRDKELTLSFAQQRLWFLDQMDPGNPQYNIPGAIRLKGNVNIPVLEQSLNKIIERHETLRTIFTSSEDGKASQKILPKLSIKLDRIDLSKLAEDKKEKETLSLANKEARKPFNLATGPLIRAQLVQLSQDEFVLIMVMHHIISDGWSVNLFVQELSAAYSAFTKGRPFPLPDLPIQYIDYAAWQRGWLTGETLDLQMNFWKKQLAGMSPYLELPTDYARPPVVTSNGTRRVFHIKADLFKELQKLSNEKETTLFITLLTVFQTLMFRYSRQEDFAVGTPVANRMRSEIEPLIGFFVNTLVLRADLSGSPSFSGLLQRNKKTALEAFDNQDIPFEKLVDAIQPERDMSHTPLFQVMFSLQRSDIQAVELPDLTLKPFNMESGTAKFDLSLEMVEHTNRLVGIIEYKTDLFKPATIDRMTEHFETLLEGITTNPERNISALPLMESKEKNQILHKWNEAVMDYPKDNCIHKLFEKQVKKTPGAAAAHFDGKILTYSELNKRANRLAHFLKKQGVNSEAIVGVLMERSLDMIVSIMAILKAGGAYLPLDPTYPHERLTFMLEDAQAPVLLTRGTLTESLPTNNITVIRLDSQWAEIGLESDENLQLKFNPENLAYLIYTSGSTGKPKGVMLQHRSALNLAENLNQKVYRRYADKQLRISLNAPIPFDASVQQIVMLTYGHALYIIPQEARGDGNLMAAYLREHKIDILDCVPSQLKLLLAAGLLDGSGWAPSAILPGGEAIDEATWKQLVQAPKTEFYNMYGPTECTVDSTICNVKSNPAQPVIGRPVANAMFYVLDKYRQPVPIGVAGELYISGDGLARGYLNQPEMTADKFIPNPFTNQPGARIYASGDLVRYLPDGNLEFLGRVDHQVKVRGFRMELGEIESNLRSHKLIKDAVVMALDDKKGDKRLTAYLIPENEKAPGISELRNYLKDMLPEYMIPALFVTLDEFPLLPNGKVNRKALPEPDYVRPDLETTYIEPRSDSEKTLAAIWKEVLGVDKVGIQDNFFELGGDSILSIQVIARANQKGLSITPKQLFENPTVEGLAAVAGTAPVIHAEQGIVSGSVKLTPIQKRFFEQNPVEAHHWNQSIMLEVKESLDPEILKQVVSKIIEHHDALRLRFKQTGGEWNQINAEVDDNIPFVYKDFSNLPAPEQLTEIEKEAGNLQESLNLEQGPIMRVAYFKRSAAELDRLLIVVHHLAIDGISWRILTESIQLVYSQIATQQNVLFPPKSTSFQYWAEKLTEYAQSDALKIETDYWLDILNNKTEPLPRDYDKGLNDEASAESVNVSLNSEETTALLQEVPAVYNTQINDALLTALLKSYEQWTGKRNLLIQLEGHGREDILEGVDISRTVGWFTSMFPVYLDQTGAGDPGAALKLIKEQLRRIPNKGIGFGLLRYLSNDKTLQDKLKSISPADMVFNYLGQFDQVVDDASPFKPVTDAAGAERSLKSKRECLLDISASVKNGQLIIQINYSGNFHKEETIGKFAEDYLDQIKLLIKHCQSTEAGGYTPSDFEDVELEEDEIDGILDELGE